MHRCTVEAHLDEGAARKIVKHGLLKEVEHLEEDTPVKSCSGKYHLAQ